jgi:uncharacterized membrane protein
MTHSTNGEPRKSDTASPKNPLQDSLQKLAGTFTERAVNSASNRLSGASGRLTDYAQSGGGSGLLAAVTGVDKLASGGSPVKSAMSAGLAGTKEKVKETLGNVKESLTGGKGKGGGKKLKLTNIIEDIDVGAPIDLVYKQWTEYPQFPRFMKKVEQADQADDTKVQWKAQVFWSHRAWEATIIEQVPFDHIVWRSKGAKGHIDGAVSFHELAPNLTRIVVVLEYHPQGFFEKTGNLWRAQGRRARLELKHFRRHVMTHTLLHPDEVEGWLGEIRDGEVVDTGETEDETETKGTKPKRARAKVARTKDTEAEDTETDDAETEDAATEDAETEEREPSPSSSRRRGADRPSPRRRADGERQPRRQSTRKEKEESRS